MLHIPYGNTHIEYEEEGAHVLNSRIGELKSAGTGLEIVKKAM